MAPDDFGERILSMLPGISLEQFQVAVAHVHKYIATPGKTGRKNRRTGTAGGLDSALSRVGLCRVSGASGGGGLVSESSRRRRSLRFPGGNWEGG
jgi:hypothetical protein